MNRTICIIFLLTVAFSLSCNRAPSVSVDAGQDMNAVEGQMVKFDAQIFNENTERKKQTFKWEFGDGNVTEGKLNPPHRYVEDGEYVAVFSLFENGNVAASDSVTVKVANDIPEAQVVSKEYSGCEGEPVYLKGHAVDSGVQDTFVYEWDMNFSEDRFDSDAQGQNIEYVWNSAGKKRIGLRIKDDDGGVSETVATEVEILKQSECGYGPKIYGVQFGMEMSAVDKILNENPEIEVVKGEGEVPRNYYDPSNIKVRPTDSYIAGFIFSGVNGVLSKITQKCGDYSGCESPMELTPEYSEYSFKGNYYGSTKSRTAFQKIGPRIFQLEAISMSAEGGGNWKEFILSVHSVDTFPPRLEVKPTDVFTHMEYPVKFSVKGWDPVSEEQPAIIWTSDDSNEPAETGSGISRKWQKPGIYHLNVSTRGTNGLETTVEVKVEVSNHRYSHDKKDLVESVGNDLLIAGYMTAWGHTLTLDGLDLPQGVVQEDKIRALKYPVLVENIKHVVESTIYSKQGNLAGYKLILRTPSEEYRDIYQDLFDSRSKFGIHCSKWIGNDIEGFEGHILDTGDLYIKIQRGVLWANAVILEVLYVPRWSADQLVEHDRGWELYQDYKQQSCE